LQATVRLACPEQRFVQQDLMEIDPEIAMEIKKWGSPR
jgi:hypothetical protein